MDGAVLGAEMFALRFFGDASDDRLLLVNLGRDCLLEPAPEPLLAPPEGRCWALDQYAAFCVLVEQLGGDWRGWEESYRHPDSPAVARFAAAHVDRVAFHAWLQWLLDEQLARAAAALPLIRDLPVGFDPAGADAWVWQDALAPGISVGAPPDEFNPLGQAWGAPPFVPAKLTTAS